jgi:hypothetical protein
MKIAAARHLTSSTPDSPRKDDQNMTAKTSSDGIAEARRRFGDRAIGPAAPDQPLPEPPAAHVDDSDDPAVVRRPRPDPSQGSRQTEPAAIGHSTGLDGYAAAVSRFGADAVAKARASYYPNGNDAA